MFYTMNKLKRFVLVFTLIWTRGHATPKGVSSKRSCRVRPPPPPCAYLQLPFFTYASLACPFHHRAAVDGWEAGSGEISTRLRSPPPTHFVPLPFARARLLCLIPPRARLPPRPVRPAAAPGAPHEEAAAGGVERPFSPTNEFTISRCAAGAHLACGRGTMPPVPPCV